MSTDGEIRARAYRVAEIVLAAPAEEGAALLESECAGDPELRAAVERLLNRDSTAGDFLEAPLLGGPEEKPDPWIGRTVGRFRIVDRLGAGGMARVYLAERVDGGFEQQVALKVLRRSMDDGEIRRHFRKEREILASLEHPLIARVLDGGTTDEGVPYLVMEYVRGTPLTEYCDRHRLGVRDRVDLMRQICGAVHSAHRSLIIHRDLKPDNILVTEDGLPKLLDFGISKIVEPAESTSEPDATAGTRSALTPRYASPEQLAGRPVTTITDVYSLGVILYELLSGRRPYEDERELLRCARREAEWLAPPPPSLALTNGTLNRVHGSALQPTAERIADSRSTSVGRLRRQLRGDLDTVILRAIRYEAAGRYGSVEQLSEDLRRVLVGLPISARSPEPAYRVRKFVGRHTVAVVTGVAVLVLLVAFSIASAIQARRLATERDRAERQRQRAEAVTQFLVQSFELADPSGTGGETLTAREVLDRAALRVSGDLVEQPDLRADVTRTIGVVYRGLGLFDESVDFLRRALSQSQTVDGEDSSEVADARQQLALSLAMNGRYEEAEALARQALQAPGLDPGVHADALTALTTALWGQGRYQTAETAIREALEISRAAFSAPDDRIADNLANLSTILAEQGQYEAAEGYAREALDMLRALHGAMHPRVVQVLNNLALLLRETGLPDQAILLQEDALASALKLFGPGHPETVINQNNFGLSLYDHGDYERALALFQEVVDARRDKLGPEHRFTANALNNLALTQRALGDYTAAQKAYEEAISIYRKVFGDEHPQVAQALQNLGFVYLERGDVAAAERLFRRALDMQARTSGEESPGVASAASALAKSLLASGRSDEARQLAEQAVRIYEATLPADSWRLAGARSVLGASLAAEGSFKEAEALLVPAYAALRETRGDRAAATRWATDRLADLYRAWNQPDKAAVYRSPTPDR